MKATHMSKFFDVDDGTLEIRLNEDGSLTGHYMAYDRSSYHNTCDLELKTIGSANSFGVRELLQRAVGKVDIEDVAKVDAAVDELKWINYRRRKSPPSKQEWQGT